jgi:hypothetical protein
MTALAHTKEQTMQLRSSIGKVMLVAIVLALAMSSIVGAAPSTLVPIQTAAFVAAVPSGWTTETTEDGRAVAAMGPAYTLRGQTFRPNLSISASPLQPGVTLERAAAVAEAGLARSLPNLRRLGQEAVRGGAGDVRIGYYLSDAQGIRLYLVTGVALLGSKWIVVTLGATSPDLPAYRDHAALFRAGALSVRAR